MQVSEGNCGEEINDKVGSQIAVGNLSHILDWLVLDFVFVPLEKV